MSINFCCPTRGKPEFVNEFLKETIERSRLPDTIFTVGIDEDEVEKYAKCDILSHERVKKVVMKRPDSLGEKFNLLAKAQPSDNYVMGVDDLAIQTIAWDVTVCDLTKMYDDGIGTVRFGKQWNEPGMPAFQLSTHKWCELQGFFMCPWFPFWWHDTWNLEMGEYLGRNLYIDIQVRYPRNDQEPMTPRRDIGFWALFHDVMRTWRMNKATEMIPHMDIPRWREYELRTSWSQLMLKWQDSNMKCRDPLWIMQFSQGRVTEELDDRHRRLRRSAEKMIEEVAGMKLSNAA
jgi:hypothetical protein